MGQKKPVLIIIAIAFIILQSSFSLAQSLAISNGVSYLQSSQTSTGYWGDPNEVPYNSFLDTCAVSDTLKSLGNTDAAYSTAIEWINSTTVNNNDYLLAQLFSLAESGNDVSSIRDYVLSIRNSDGGWGVAEGLISDIKRTALALQAFKASNYDDYSVLFQAISFLESNQNTDGGWGSDNGYETAESDVLTTAIVLKSLLSFKSTFLNQEPIDKAVSYLLSKQNPDGGFGSSPSNVYETGVAIDALIASGSANLATTVANGTGYLTTTQLSNGSWDDDSYSTALALRALASARPNLTITSITESSSMPRENQETTITATIKNSGYDNASNVVVRFFLGDPSNGGTQIGTDQIIQLIAPGSWSEASVTASFTGTGGKTIYVAVDPDNAVSETSEGDNTSFDHIWVATEPDLTIYSEDLVPSSYVPATETAFTLEYWNTRLETLGKAGRARLH